MGLFKRVIISRVIAMYPVLFELGPITFYSYGLMIGLGFVAGVLVASKRAEMKGIDPDSLFWFILALLAGGVVGGRLFHIALNSWHYTDWKSVLDTRNGGLSIHGVLMGGLVAAAAYSRFRLTKLTELLDLVVPGVALGQAIGRIGCLLSGCCYGMETSGTWGFATRFAPGLRHPYPLYESVADFLLFLTLIALAKRIRVSGGLFLVYAFGYSVIRFFLEFVRDNSAYVLGLSYAQWGSLAAALVALGVYVYVTAKEKSPLGSEVP